MGQRGQLVDLSKKRKEKTQERKRQVERVMFRHFIGLHATVKKDDKLIPLEVINLSKKGILLQSEYDLKWKNNDEINILIYFTTESFINICVHIKHSHEYLEGGRLMWRYGGEFDTKTGPFKVMTSFINFMYLFAEFSREEHKLRKLR